MILYTPLAVEDIFFDANEAQTERSYIQYEGKYYCVDKNKFGYELVGITSTDPNDYMNDLFRPGTYL
ncbi:YlzJ-like family protein [Oceanobacillus sp. CAU 1775]